MEFVGIICEYNPFHRGHAAQLRRIGERFPDAVKISLMSGSFVQRGEAAVMPKYSRAEAAIRAGADLVFELPYPWNCARAEIFAQAGVSVLSMLGVQILCFGSETGDEAELLETAKRLESQEFRQAFAAAREEEKHGETSSVRLGQKIYEELFGKGFPTRPNDILGVEYCRAILRLGADMKPVSYPRAADYTASGARALIMEGKNESLSSVLPPETLREMTGDEARAAAAFSPILLTVLRLADPEELERISGIPEGFAARMCAKARTVTDTDALVRALVSKRETAAQVRRLLIACALKAGAERAEVMPAYAQLLGASGRGRKALRALQKTSLLPILTKPADYVGLPPAAAEQFRFNLRAETLTAAAWGIPSGDLVRKKPYMGE